MDEQLLRAWWWHRQGLDGSLRGKGAAEVLTRSGWSRSVGGVGPYLTLFSRSGSSRAAVDRAVAALEIHELPTARGCTYVVPADDFPLGLAVGQGFADGEMKVAASLGVTEKEIAKLEQAVVGAVAKSPLEPDQIRAAVGAAARSLGDAGKKKGLTTTLPVALGRLQARGEIRRVPLNGRLDQQRYAYVQWRPNPLDRFSLSPEAAFAALARKFFGWVGPATLAEFQWFSGLGVKAARAAVESLRLETIEPGADRLLLAEDVDSFRRFATPRTPQYALVSGIDAISALRRDVATLLDPSDRKRKILAPTGRAGASVLDLPDHGIFDRGRLIGLWEYDPEAEAIVWATFGVKDKALEAAVAETERYVREELGDARAFSLDSPKSRAPKIAALRTLA